MVSTFSDWFERQFGERPSPVERDVALQEAIDKGVQASQILTRCREYDVKRTAALYAWTVRHSTDEEISQRFLSFRNTVSPMIAPQQDQSQMNSPQPPQPLDKQVETDKIATLSNGCTFRG